VPYITTADSDTKDAATLQDAKGYTDTELAAGLVPYITTVDSDAKDATTLQDAKDYTDGQDASLQGQIDDNVDDIYELNAIDRHGSQLWDTAGTYSWTVPAGVQKVYVTILGAGGGAASKDSSSYTQMFSGGDGASYWKYEILVEGGYQVDFIVGAGGISNLGAPTTGGDGDASTLAYFDSDPSHTISIIADGGSGAQVNTYGGGSHGTNASPLQGPLMRNSGNGSNGSPAGADGMLLLEW
jgi:hypothetical protein